MLDKPNAHRLVELYLHTISLFFSCHSGVWTRSGKLTPLLQKLAADRIIALLLHYIRVYISFGSYWCALLYSLYIYWSNVNPTERFVAKLDLRIVLLVAITIQRYSHFLRLGTCSMILGNHWTTCSNHQSFRWPCTTILGKFCHWRGCIGTYVPYLCTHNCCI